MENPCKKTTVSAEPVGDGLGVFDPAQNKAYFLNATSALVWQNCDGNTCFHALAALLVRKFNVTEAQAAQLTQAALDELTNSALLETEVKLQPVAMKPKVLHFDGKAFNVTRDERTGVPRVTVKPNSIEVGCIHFTRAAILKLHALMTDEKREADPVIQAGYHPSDLVKGTAQKP